MINIDRKFLRGGLAGIVAVTVAGPTAVLADSFKPSWFESGMADKASGLPEIFLEFSSTAPDKFPPLPEGVAHPQFADFQTGAGDPRLSHAVVVEVKDKVPTRLFIDANADGEFSPEEVFNWTPSTVERGNGEKSIAYLCRMKLKLNSAGKMGVVNFRYLRRGAFPQSLDEPLLGCRSDYGFVGELTIGNRTLPAALVDSAASANYLLTTNPAFLPQLWLAVTTNGLRGRSVMTPVNRTFPLEHFVWAITNLTPDGAFDVVAVATNADASANGMSAHLNVPPPDLIPGQTAPSFTAKLMDGKSVNFPDDYKGKLVLMDFGATWCGPCVAELPNVVANYGKYHNQGLEVLSISLDKEDSAKKIARVLADQNMTWPQIYDGKNLESPIAKRFGIHSIPSMLLVDGDTGVILADGKELRGEQLGVAIAAALAGKKK